jgi:translation initiation factor 2B subunit (eIF-2B alpha/beta/delta family)
VYVDGVAYATRVLAAFPNASVQVIPDANIGNVFLEFRQKRWVVLFGANGISDDGSISHSAGHLTTAIVAKYYGLPVILVSDSSKVGPLEPHPLNEREDQWLKGLLAFRGREGRQIEFENIQESITPSALIDKIVTEDGIFTTQEFAQRYRENALE